MNAIVSLVHFCEVDGPSVIFCTQAFHENAIEETATEDFLNISRRPSLITSLRDLNSNSNSSNNNTLTVNSNASNTITPKESNNQNGNTINNPNSVNNNGLQMSRKESTNVGERPPVQASSCSSCAFPLFSIDQSRDQKETMTGKGIDEVKGVEGGEKSDPKIRFNNNCESIKGFKTKDDENPLVTYIGSRYPQHPRLYSALRQACVRSLSCEYCQGREGPVLFGDDKNGYVLSYMFKIKDTQARGSNRWYSFICLMTDRIYLVTSWPFLFQSLATNLQSKANQIFEKENIVKESLEDPNNIHNVNNTINITNSNSNRSSTFSSSRSGGAALPPISPDQFLRRRANQALRSLIELLKTKLDIKGMCNNNNNKELRELGIDIKLDDIKDLYNAMGSMKFIELMTNFLNGNQLIFHIPPSPPPSSTPEQEQQQSLSTLIHKIIKSIIIILQDFVPNNCCSVMENQNVYQPLSKCNILVLNEKIQMPNNVDKSTICVINILFENIHLFITFIIFVAIINS
nr:12966_t:CDS:2 [Entrophospora candida]